MASISMQPPIHTSQFVNTPPSPSRNMSAHMRKKSRNPAAPLPSFTFHPGSISADVDGTSLPIDSVTEASSTTRTVSRAPELPTFKFNPGADLPADDERSNPTHPVLEEMAMNQQRIARSARPSPLPAFTFTPGASSQVTPSPTRTEFNETNLARPSGGHKRAGSEFVGGGGTEGPTLISTSPQKHESRPSGPPVTGAGRRGHVHRRSQAISISDIDTSDLIKVHAIAKARRESEPPSLATSPVGTPSMPHFPAHATLQQRHSISTRSPPRSPHRHDSASSVRPRVEFADKIDVIPRPLSMISSETEGSCSTVRYSHSLTNSINSIASPVRGMSVSSPISEDAHIIRPKTADFSALSTSAFNTLHRDENEVALPVRPISAYGLTVNTMCESLPSKRKHFWFSHSPDRTPTSTPKSERSDPLANLPEFAPSKTNSSTRPKTSPERSTTVRRRKYHTWTGGIFQKKTKQRATRSKGRRPLTHDHPNKPIGDQVNEIFDADDTIVLRSDSPELKRSRPRLDVNISSTSPTPNFESEEEVASPVLDLDAALDPFGSEDRLGSDLATRTAASRIARLHSSERRGLVDAFGVVHRRTESAPSMPAFNRSGHTISRHASNPSLAEDVFDEEEEDNFLATQTKAQRSGNGKQVDNGRSSQISKREISQSGGLGLANVSDFAGEVVIVDAEEEVGGDCERSSNSTIEPPIHLESEMPKRPMSSPMSFAYPSTQSHYASSTEGRTTTTASIISSPDPDHGLLDGGRLNSAMGQHSPDFYLRPSNDDLPSLSDSISSGAVPRISSSANTRSSIDHPPEQRSASMFVPGTSRSNQSWKRASLASLNRLIPGSANGSRLKFETMPDAQSEKNAKRKSHRLSRLVSFWRTKEKEVKS